MIGPRLEEPLVAGGREADILAVTNQGDRKRRDVDHGLEVEARLVGRAIVDDDQFPGRVGVPGERLDALAALLQGVETGKNDRCGKRTRRLIGHNRLQMNDALRQSTG